MPFLKGFIWVISVFFYFYEFLLSVYPSFMADALKEMLHIDSEKVGFIVSVYFYTLAPMQLSMGVLIDRYGARRLLTLAAFICGFSVLLFSFATHLAVITVARLLVGLGSSFAFVGMLHQISYTFSKKRMTLLIGVANSCAMIVAATGGGQVSLLETFFGLRQTVGLHGAVGLLLSFVLLLMLRKQKKEEHHMAHSPARIVKEIFHYFAKSMKTPLAWTSTLISLFLYVICSLWGVSFLQEAHGLRQNDAGFVASLIYFGWIFGNLSSGFLSDRLKNPHHLLMFSSVLALLSLLPVIFITPLSFPIVSCLLFLMGFFAAEILTLSYVTNKPKSSISSLSGFLVMSTCAFFQPFISFILDLFWSWTQGSRMHFFTMHNCQWLLASFSLTFLLAFFLTFFSKGKKRWQPSKISTK